MLYSINRHFNYTNYPNKINLSNDGQVIAYINDFYGNDKIAARKSLTFYKSGELIKSYTTKELTNCNDNVEDCHLLYQNKEVLLRDSTKYRDGSIHLGFRAGTSDPERFAHLFNAFANHDTLYLINKNKEVLTFSLLNGALLATATFESSYDYLKSSARINDFRLTRLKAPDFYDLPDLIGGEDFYPGIADYIGMKPFDAFNTKDNKKYKKYTVILDCIIDRQGIATINSIDVDEGLPEDRIIFYLKSVKFDMSSLPNDLDHWRIREDYFYFRNKSNLKAKKEKRKEQAERQQAYLKRLTRDSINDFYIPKNLGECLVQLDTLLQDKDKTAIKNLGSRHETINYHLGLGMWLRNNWGLWGGSRLQTYFYKREIGHPDSMSAIILEYYYDWLQGDKESWRAWETNHPEK